MQRGFHHRDGSGSSGINGSLTLTGNSGNTSSSSGGGNANSIQYNSTLITQQNQNQNQNQKYPHRILPSHVSPDLCYFCLKHRHACLVPVCEGWLRAENGDSGVMNQSNSSNSNSTEKDNSYGLGLSDSGQHRQNAPRCTDWTTACVQV